MVEETKDKIETLGFAQIVNRPTRFWKNTRPSLLDQVWANKLDIINYCKNISDPVANHNLVDFSVNLRSCPNVKSEILKIIWISLNFEDFCQGVNNVNWNQIYDYSDVNITYYFLENNMSKYWIKLFLSERSSHLEVKRSGSPLRHKRK